MPDDLRPAVELSIYFGDVLLAVVPLHIPGSAGRVELRPHGDPAGSGQAQAARVRLGTAAAPAPIDPTASLSTRYRALQLMCVHRPPDVEAHT
jgi:hypothetical protein